MGARISVQMPDGRFVEVIEVSRKDAMSFGAAALRCARAMHGLAVTAEKLPPAPEIKDWQSPYEAIGRNHRRRR